CLSWLTGEPSLMPRAETRLNARPAKARPLTSGRRTHSSWSTDSSGVMTAWKNRPASFATARRWKQSACAFWKRPAEPQLPAPSHARPAVAIAAPCLPAPLLRQTRSSACVCWPRTATSSAIWPPPVGSNRRAANERGSRRRALALLSACRIGCGDERQLDGEGTALAERAFHPRPAAVRFGDLAGDEQPQPETAVVLAGDAALEAGEDLIQVFRRNPGAGIRHRQSHPLAVTLDTNVDAGIGSVLAGVRDQVHQRLLHPQLIPPPFEGFRRMDMDVAGCLPDQLRQPLDRFPDRRRQIEGAELELDAAGTDARDVQQRVDQLGQPLGALQCPPDGTASPLRIPGRGVAFHQQLDALQL